MKIFIFTYDRFDSISTSRYFDGIPHTVLCHTEEQKQRFLDAGNIYTNELIATDKPRGLAYNRNVALDMMTTGEWAVFFVDDLISMTYLDKYEEYEKNKIVKLGITVGNQSTFKKGFETTLEAKKFLSLSEKLIFHAECRGYALCGFSLTPNTLFRNKKYSYWALADGRCWLVKKTHLRFDENVQLIDDTCWTALNLKAFGGVAIDNWILPLCKRYTSGAFGSIEQRMPQKLAECEYLVKTYPDIISFANKAGWPAKSHVRIRNSGSARE